MDTTFSAGTVIASAWLQDVNDHVYDGTSFDGVSSINLMDPTYGVTGDGVTDDTDAINAVFAAAVNKEVVVPPLTYRIDSTVTIPNGSTVRFMGKGANFLYYGSGSAVNILNSKKIDLHGIHINLTNAGASAVGLHVRGCWFLNLYSPKIVGGNASQTGIKIETSQTGGDDHGAYMISIFNADLQTGPFATGIKTLQTASDSVAVTHLSIYDGWISTATDAVYLRNCNVFRIEGLVVDSVVDCLDIDDCTWGFVSPGEWGPATGYGINWGSNNTGMQLVAPASGAGSTPSLGYQNNSSYTPTTFSRDTVRLYGSSTAQDYYYELKSIYAYGGALTEKIKGGGNEITLKTYSDGTGQLLNSVGGISGTTTAAKNLRGTATFSSATTVGVTLPVEETNNSYYIALSGNAAGYCWVTNKLSTGFTINCSASNSNAVDWILVR